MNYTYMSYVRFGYKDPNINKYLKGINNAYKKQYLNSTTPVERLGKIVHDGINEASVALTSKTILPNVPLNSRASNALEAQDLIRVRNKYQKYQDNPRQRAKHFEDGVNYKYDTLTHDVNGKKTAVGVAWNVEQPSGNTMLNVIGNPKYSGKVLKSSRDYILERPNTMFEVSGLTPRHDYIYNKYLSNNPMPNVKLKKP